MQNLTPRDGAKIPDPDKPNLSPQDLAAEIARLTQSESAALTILASEMQAARFATEDNTDLLQSIKDLLVKAMGHFGIPLPAGIEADMKTLDKDGEPLYNPDALNDSEEDEDDDEDEAKP